MSKKLTVHDLLAGKGKRTFTEIFTMDEEEAAACDAAGIDILVTPMSTAEAVRAAAPNVLLTVGVGIYQPEIASETEAVRAGFEALQKGGDAVYTGMSLACVRAMAREHIPVVGHVGYVPYRATWFGGARAVGKTADEAVRVYRETRAYEEAGAIGVEMEIVPERVAAEISKRTGILVISMGSGSGCDAQYLFATDVLGTNTGHVPRHAKQYADLHAELQRLQAMRVEAFKTFHEEVRGGAYPEAKHRLPIQDAEYDAFLRQLG